MKVFAMPIVAVDRRLKIVTLISIFVTLFGCAALVFLAHSRGLNPLTLTGDSKGYVLLAQNLIDHHVFSMSSRAPFELESFRAPGYPTFLAMVFSLFGFTLISLFVHALITSLAPIFLYILIRPLHEKTAFWASIVFIFEPVRIFLSASFLSDAFFTTIFLATLVLVTSVKEGNVLYRSVCTGLLLGACILVRPIAIFLPLLFAVYIVYDLRFSKRAFLAGLLVGIGALVAIFPWIYRNHSLFDSWNISSVGVANLALYNAPEFLKWQPSSAGERLLEQFRAEQARLPHHEALSLARSDTFEDTFLEIIRGHELQYMYFHVFKTIPFFITDGLRDTVRLFKIDIGSMPNLSTAIMNRDFQTFLSYLLSNNIAVVLLVFGSTFWASIFVLFVFWALRALVRCDSIALFLFLIFCDLAALAGPVSIARFRMPVEGLLIASAGLILFRWYESLRETNHS